MRDIFNVQEQEQTSPATTPPPAPTPTTTTPSSSSSTTTTHWAPHQAAAAVAEHHQREHMFEKVVTPSDVGKLNRLVIPKQHAERYFPLDPAANDKGGLLLNFEEGPTGRPWRFRYSYWNSSQSYVMTKGWSRFVKDKRLDAGDTVSFSRSPSDPNRLFIDWRRRPIPLPPTLVPTCWGWSIPHPPPPLYFRSVTAGPVPAPQVMMRAHDANDHHHGILDSVPVRDAQHAEPKRQMRLFGVNIEEERPQPPPQPIQWRLSGSARAPPTPRRSGCSELQLMPMGEGRR